MLTNIYSCNSTFCILVLLSPQGSVANFYNILQSSKPVCQHLSLSHVKTLVPSWGFLHLHPAIASAVLDKNLSDWHPWNLLVWNGPPQNSGHITSSQTSTYILQLSTLPSLLQQKEEVFSGQFYGAWLQGLGAFSAHPKSIKYFISNKVCKMIDERLHSTTNSQETSAFCLVLHPHTVSLVASCIGAGRNGTKSNPGVVSAQRKKKCSRKVQGPKD